MKLNTKFTSLSRALGSQLALGLLASLCLTSSAIAKGKPGGGGGGEPPPPTEPPVAPPIAPPINYDEIELTWNEVAHQGVLVNSINSSGRAVGFVKHPADPGETAFRDGVINALDAWGAPTNSMIDLNGVFSASLEALNDARAEAPWFDGPWRIAYGRKINEVGQIACQLIPADAPMSIDEYYLPDGVDAVPTLLAVADLGVLNPNAMVVVDPDNISPNQDILELNENGDLLVQDGKYVDKRGHQYFLNSMYVRQGGVYVEVFLPDVTDWHPSFNSSRQIATAPHLDMDKLYRITDGEWDLLWEVGRKESFYVDAISEDGTVYATKNSDGIGPIYRITDTEQIPLTNEQSSASMAGRTMSRAGNGNEELLIKLLEFGNYQIYQPNLGARFPLDAWIAPGTIGWVAISPPNGPIGTLGYMGGYIAYFNNDAVARSFILTPMPGTP